MSGLKIACLTPWNEKSAIARSASIVTNELERRGHEVTVFRTEVGEALELPPLPAKREIQQLKQWSARDLRGVFEVRLAHVGDHFGFHGGLVSRMRDFGAIGVFHDAFLADLVNGWAHCDESVLRAVVSETYGDDAWPMGQPFLGDLGEVMAKRPMLEWFSRQTLGAVGHAEHYAERLRASCKGPVAVIPLAYEYADLPDPPHAWNRVTVATVGQANANKRIDQVILAVGSSPILRSCCRVKVIGEASEAERRRLTLMTRRLDIAPPLFTGSVSDDELRWQLRDVDVMSCLRNPVLEGASASLILALSSKRPVLVSDHGCYAELPDDVLLKCSPGREAVDVMRHLEKFVKNRFPYEEMGARAARLASSRHSASNYVDQLQQMLESVAGQRPRDVAECSLMAGLAALGVAEDDAASARVRSVLGGLLEGRPSCAMRR